MLHVASWSARTASAFALVFLLALAAVPGGASAQTTGLVAVGFGADGYQYQQVARGGGGGFEQPSYDASSWAVGAAAFGSPGPCGFNSNGSIQTAWAVGTDLLVRKAVYLNPGATNVVITGTVDNDATLYFNGAAIGTFGSGNCIPGAIWVQVPAALLAADGNNLLAVRGSDYGVSTYLDLQVTYDDGPAYGVCPLHDATKAHKSGSTVPLKLQLCNAGANLSDPSVVVNASGIYQLDPSAVTTVVPDAGNANPDQDFRYTADFGGYIYNLKTTGLTSGTWVVTFTVNGEADSSYYVTFDVR